MHTSLSMHHFCRVGVLGLALVLAAGCGGSPFTVAKVTGKVTLNSRPVTQGKVIFRPAKGPVAVGALGPGGVFTLTTFEPNDGAIVGECAIAIDAPTWGAPMAGFTPPAPPPPEETIPMKFRSFETSGLTRTVQDQDNVFDFELGEL